MYRLLPNEYLVGFSSTPAWTSRTIIRSRLEVYPEARNQPPYHENRRALDYLRRPSHPICRVSRGLRQHARLNISDNNPIQARGNKELTLRRESNHRIMRIGGLALDYLATSPIQRCNCQFPLSASLDKPERGTELSWVFVGFLRVHRGTQNGETMIKS